MSAAPQTVSPFQRIRHSLRASFMLLAVTYGVMISLLLALKWLIGERWTAIAFFNSILHLALIPALILLVLALLLRRWRAAAVVALPAIVFIVSYAGVFLPQSVDAPSDAPHLHLMTFNLLSKTDDLDGIMAIIRESDADIVALQELSETAADRLSDTFAARYPYQALHPGDPYGVYGLGVFSRFPIEADTYKRIYLAYQRVELLVEGQPVILYNAHPIQPLVNRDGFALREQEISDVLARADSDSGPVILMGDFNMTDQSEDYGRVTARYHDTWHEVGWGLGPTFPAVYKHLYTFDVPFRVVRLDYVFHSDHFQALSIHTGDDSGGSDHAPLFAQLALIGTPS